MPYAVDNDVLKVAVADPGNLHALDELRLATKLSLDIGVASRDDILAELQRLARTAEAIGSVVAVELDEEADTHDDGDDLEADDGISDGPLVRLVNAIIFQAAEENASDVHFEPQEDALVVRFRVDGVLREVQRVPKKMAAGVTTRLKVLAKLDIAERRKPQDGRITLSASAVGRTLDIRVATLPTVEGEKVGHAPPRQVAEAADDAGARPLRRDARRTRVDREDADRSTRRHRARPARASRRRCTAAWR